jgi:Zn-dependent membrane protease YugP
MPVILIFLFLFVLLCFGMKAYIEGQLHHYSQQQRDLAYTGEELINALFEEAKVTGVGVKLGLLKDYYTPNTQDIYMQEVHFKGKSLASACVAAFLAVQAIAHFKQESGLKNRFMALQAATRFQRFAAGVMIAALGLFAFIHAVHLFLGLFAVGFLMMSAQAYVYLTSLPLEQRFADTAFDTLSAHLESNDAKAVQHILTLLKWRNLSFALSDMINPREWLKRLKK